MNQKFEDLVEYVCGSLLMLIAIIAGFGIIMLAVVGVIKFINYF